MTPERITEVKKILEKMNPGSQLFPITVGDLLSLLAALEETQHQHQKVIKRFTGQYEGLERDYLQAQQTIARQREGMDRASDMMSHRHPAYRLLQEAILPAGEDDQP